MSSSLSSPVPSNRMELTVRDLSPTEWGDEEQHDNGTEDTMGHTKLLMIVVCVTLFLFMVVWLLLWMQRQVDRHIARHEQQPEEADFAVSVTNTKLDPQAYLTHVKLSCTKTTHNFSPHEGIDIGSSSSTITEENSSVTVEILEAEISNVWEKAQLSSSSSDDQSQAPRLQVEIKKQKDHTCAICLEQYQLGVEITLSSCHVPLAVPAGGDCCTSETTAAGERTRITGVPDSSFCPHSFHTHCFLQYAQAVLQNEGIDTSKGIPCPLCRQPFISAPQELSSFSSNTEKESAQIIEKHTSSNASEEP